MAEVLEYNWFLPGDEEGTLPVKAKQPKQVVFHS